MEILFAFILMLPLALVASILLSVLSHFFAVREDPKKIEIRECLPGVNCGACGYRGCDDYAAALVEGVAKPNLCIPGAQAVADQIGAILGIEAEPFKDVVAFVACNGNCEATTLKAEYDGIKTCKAATMVYAGGNSCAYGCLGFGDCAEACPANAICTIDGIAHIDSSKCLGCGICKNICPKQIIKMIPQDATSVVMCSNKQKGADARKACKNACIGCKKCEKVCQQGAITVNNNVADIDYEKCNHCGMCAKECPTGCLKNVFLPDLADVAE